jgi:hypothetical protein
MVRGHGNHGILNGTLGLQIAAIQNTKRQKTLRGAEGLGRVLASSSCSDPDVIAASPMRSGDRISRPLASAKDSIGFRAS